LEKDRKGEQNEKSVSPRKAETSPHATKDPAAVQTVQQRSNQVNNTDPLYTKLIDKARWSNFMQGVVANAKASPKPPFGSTQIVNNIKLYWLNYYAIFLGLLLLFA